MIDLKEMYRTFNMGVGFCLISGKADADDIISVFSKYKIRCTSIGSIGKGRGEVVAKIAGKRETL